MTNADQAPDVAEAVRPRAIGLCMIVKNEAHVLRRCLERVKLLIDYVLIEDTGSTDGTQALVIDWLKRNDIPGAVIEEPWRDFAYNRSHALEKLREAAGIDYALIIDADDQLVAEPGFDAAAFKAGLAGDIVDVEIRHGGTRYWRPQFCSNRLPFAFKGVLHEYLETPPGEISRSTARGIHIETGRGGARNKNPRKYQDDAATLERALAEETDPFLTARYTFYLAQSYNDCGERERALENYLKRAELGYWAEEVFESLYHAAQLQEALGFAPEAVIATYERATEAAPTRAEALYGASRLCRLKGLNEQGYQLAKRGLEVAFPDGGLFVESWIYDYALLDELAINAYWTGRYRESLDACLKLLEGAALPAGERKRVGENARFALAKLPDQTPTLGSLGEASLVAQHPLAPERDLGARLADPPPRVLLAILAKQKQEMLPLYLDCIEALDYPKSRISLYVRINNNTDRTEEILQGWLRRVGPLYDEVEFDASDVDAPVQEFRPHEWNAARFQVLGAIRNLSLGRALERTCAYYFVVDVDNFIRPATLRELVALDLPIVAPLLRSLEPARFYSNYHAEIDRNGYYAPCDQYQWILNRWVRGVVEVPVVHTTYLVRADVIPRLSYLDDTSRHEYVVFSESARRAGVTQYLDNRQVYGYVAFGRDSDQYVEGGLELARSLLGEELGRRPSPAPPAAPRRRSAPRPRLFACLGLHSSGSTWMFNLIREVCRAAGLPFVSAHRDSSANLPWDAAGAPLIVARTHNPMADFQALLAASSDPAVITTRDPRDAVVSFMQRFPTGQGASFERAMEAVALSAERLVAVASQREVPVFRYEDGFVGADATVVKLAALLGTKLKARERAAILAGLSPGAVRKTIGELEAAGVIRGEAVWDRETHWHAGHVGDGRIGKWSETLSPAQAEDILERTRPFRELFGYADAREPAAPELAP